MCFGCHSSSHEHLKSFFYRCLSGLVPRLSQLLTSRFLQVLHILGTENSLKDRARMYAHCEIKSFLVWTGIFFRKSAWFLPILREQTHKHLILSLSPRLDYPLASWAIPHQQQMTITQALGGICTSLRPACIFRERCQLICSRNVDCNSLPW